MSMTTTSFTAPTSKTTTARAVGTFAPDSPLGPLEIERRALGPKDVRIDIKFCGICHSDIHFARGEWGEVPYPAVPGHEIAGVVAEVGSDVTKFAPGDRVGVGCMVNSCRECDNCLAGNEQYCLVGNTQTYGSVDRDGTITYGRYSDHVGVDADFVVTIADGLALDAAPPQPLPVPAMQLILQRRTFAGSAIGSIRETQEMLDFCAEHGIAAEIEVVSADQVNDAWERVLASDVRYRFVIDNGTLAEGR